MLGLGARGHAFDLFGVGETSLRQRDATAPQHRWLVVDGSLGSNSIEQAKAILDTNFLGVVRMTRAVVPHMRRQGSGRIINITSVVGELARAGDAVYPAAKQGMTGMMRALAMEYAPLGITSNAIAPGTFSVPPR